MWNLECATTPGSVGYLRCEFQIPNSKLEHSVHAPIPIVGAAARVDVELLADAVDLPLQIAVLQLGERIHPRALQEDVGDEESAQVRGVGDAAGLAQRREERDRAHDRDE